MSRLATILMWLLLPFTGVGQSLAIKMERAGMVDVGRLDTTLRVSLMYATKDNFVGANMYGDLRQAYLHPDAARALVKAQQALRQEKPGYSLLIKDAARPMSAQRRMYDCVRGTSKARYVANPRNGGGMHNYGVAVDVTIVGPDGRELPMGTPVDHLGSEANINAEEALMKRGVITEAERQNRLLLRRVMRKGGFMPLRSEWWHFNLVGRSTARKRYRLLNF